MPNDPVLSTEAREGNEEGTEIFPPAASPDPSVQASKRPESAFAGVSQFRKRTFKRTSVRSWSTRLRVGRLNVKMIFRGGGSEKINS